jgi:hypothetical protein
MNYLIFVNSLGPNFKGDNIYEFIFSENIKEVWDESWNYKPSLGYPKPPKLDFISKVGVLRNTNIELDLIQNSDFFSFIDSVDDVVSLAWEKENEDIDFSNKKRLTFRYGQTEKEIKDKLYERDLILEFEKIKEYEKE